MKNTIFLVFLWNVLSFAQISINSSDILGLIGSSGSLKEDTTGSVTVNVGQGGENQFWDLSELTVHGITLDYMFLDPAGSEQGVYFPQANLLQQASLRDEEDEMYYSFLQVNPGSITALGYIYSNSDTAIIDPANEEWTSLPILYGNNWVSVEKDCTEFDGGYFINIDSSFTVIDGWGTVTVPGGTFECLRLRDNNTYISKSVFGEFVFGDTMTTINYEWLTKNNFVVATIESTEGESNPDFSIAEFVSVLQESQAASSLKEDTDNLSQNFSLRQNYPNPFNPVTTIHYQIPVNSNVSLILYDNLGRKIKRLVDNWQSAGNYSAEVHADGMTSGIYYYRLQTDNFSQVRRMVLIK